MAPSANDDLEKLHADARETDGRLLKRARVLAMKLGASEAAEQMRLEISRLRPAEPANSLRSRVAQWVEDVWDAGVSGAEESFTDEERAAAAKVPWPKATKSE
jgi:hypothetical protein